MTFKEEIPMNYKKAEQEQHEAEDSSAWFLKLWCAYHYWYVNHCLLVRGLNKKSKYKKDKN
jgi:hypothetical protein